MRLRQAVLFLFLLALITQNVHGYLGGFELSDGYRDIILPQDYANDIWDVSLYNSGQFGTITGGVDNGSNKNNIVAGTLWSRTVGPTPQTAGLAGGFSYATAHQNADRTYVNSFPLGQRVLAGDPRRGLIITTNADGWNAGPSKYSYRLDQYDANPVSGVGASAPSPIADNQVVKISFLGCTELPVPPIGQLAAGSIGNIVSFADLNAAVGLKVGYKDTASGPDVAWYEAGNSGTGGTVTSVPITPGRYHRWDITMDMIQNVVEASLFDPFAGTNGTTYSVIPSGTPALANLANLAELQFTSTPGESNQKYWSVDDFGFTVIPEPSTIALAGLALVGGALNRRRLRLES